MPKSTTDELMTRCQLYLNKHWTGLTPDDRDDVLAEALCRLYTQCGGAFDLETVGMGVVIGTVRNVAHEMARARKRCQTVDAMEDDAQTIGVAVNTPSVEDAVCDRILSQKLLSAMKPRWRQVALLVADGFTTQEIGYATETTANAVQQLLGRARRHAAARQSMAA